MSRENTPITTDTVDYVTLKTNLLDAINEKLLLKPSNPQLLRIKNCLVDLLKTHAHNPEELRYCGDKIRLLMLEYHLFDQGITSCRFIQLEKPNAISYEIEILRSVILGEHAPSQSMTEDYLIWAQQLAEDAYKTAGVVYQQVSSTVNTTLSQATKTAVTYCGNFFLERINEQRIEERKLKQATINTVEERQAVNRLQ